MFSDGKQISTLNWLVPGEDRYYSLTALRFDGDASEDPEIRQVFGSFRFMHHFVPSYTADSLAFRIGYVTGILMFIITSLAIGVYFVRRGRTPRPQRPPPLPPGVR